MNINPISFKGTFCIDRNSTDSKKYLRILSKKDDYCITYIPSYYNNPDKLFIYTPDKYDEKMIRFLNALKVGFTVIPQSESLNDENVISRLILSDADEDSGLKLKTVNIKKLDRELQKNPDCYVGKNGANGSGLKYDRFKRFLDTNQQIVAPRIYLRKYQDGSITTHIYDGRHRFAVLRDMGLTQIPVSIDDESISLAKEINLL